MFFYLIYMVNKIMEQDSNDEVRYVQNTSRSSRNSVCGGGIDSHIGQVYKDMRIFLMITVLGYHLHKNVNGTD